MRLVFVLACLICFGFASSLDYKNWIDDGYKTFANGKEALSWGNTWTKGSIFSAKEKGVIFEYSKSSSQFNDKLRRGQDLATLPSQEQEKIKALDSALNKFILFEKIIVYRYEKIDLLQKLYGSSLLYSKIYSHSKFLPTAEETLKNLSAKTYTDYGFMSTTMIRNSLFHYRPIELVIKIPQYSDGLFIAREGFSHFITEYEILFPRNRMLNFEGISISKDRKKITIYAKMKGPLWIVHDK